MGTAAAPSRCLSPFSCLTKFRRAPKSEQAGPPGRAAQDAGAEERRCWRSSEGGAAGGGVWLEREEELSLKSDWRPAGRLYRFAMGHQRTAERAGFLRRAVRVQDGGQQQQQQRTRAREEEEEKKRKQPDGVAIICLFVFLHCPDVLVQCLVPWSSVWTPVVVCMDPPPQSTPVASSGPLALLVK